MTDVLGRELVYLWYYFDVQLRQIFWYWIIGMAIGSLVSVFAKDGIRRLFAGIESSRWGAFGILPACLLGVLSPLCMYGTIPIAASFRLQGMREDWLAAFMMSSVLLNPQLIIYSAALGGRALAVRIVSALLCGICAGFLVMLWSRRHRGKAAHAKATPALPGDAPCPKATPALPGEAARDISFFRFDGFEEGESRDTHPNPLIRYLKSFGRNVKATGLYFLIGIMLSAVFQRYVPAELMTELFGGNEAWGVLMAATIGVPLYVCGGGTIPILAQWLADGMSLGSAAAFMITGPATKITNLGAVKIVLGAKHFALYLVFVLLFACGTGLAVNLLF